MAKLNVKAFGLAVGIVWGVGMFVLGIIAMAFGWGDRFVEILSSLYIGYKATFLGSIVGAVWGFIDAGIGGIIVAWLYNKFAK
ncbi:MAG: bacteriophage holin [Candidatus Omnitrophica bacterium]|nr:bacteriophage holin [Candidatus Omnitrophota bacterium]